MIARINPLKNTIEGKDNFSRNLYVLVAVRSPDHHGLFVGDLAGGDGVDLLDVLDLGNGLHGCVFMCVIKVRKRLACPSLKSCGRGSVSRKNFHAFRKPRDESSLRSIDGLILESHLTAPPVSPLSRRLDENSISRTGKAGFGPSHIAKTLEGHPH